MTSTNLIFFHCFTSLVYMAVNNLGELKLKALSYFKKYWIIVNRRIWWSWFRKQALKSSWFCTFLSGSSWENSRTLLPWMIVPPSRTSQLDEALLWAYWVMHLAHGKNTLNICSFKIRIKIPILLDFHQDSIREV